MSCVVENIMVVSSGNTLRESCLAFENGRIIALDDCPDPATRVDGRGLLLLPGVIDPHTHFDEPGYTSREDFAHGSRGAIAGGVTTVGDMPGTSIPPVTSESALDYKLSCIQPKAYCDFALWGGVSANALKHTDWQENMASLARRGVIGFKTYTLSGMDSFHHLSYDQFPAVMRCAAEQDTIIGVHAEDAHIVTEATQQVAGRTDALAYYESRPVAAEVEAIRCTGSIAGETNARLHIVHLSSGSGAREVARLQEQQVDISAETCPHYLAFNIDDLCRIGPVLKCAPVVKSRSEQDVLWTHLDSTVSFLATDHAPCTLNEKRTGNFFSDYGGMPGVELLLPFILTYGYHAGRLTLEQIIRLTSENAARRYRLFPRKGCLEPGSDADFVLVNLNEEYVVDAAALQTKGKFTPFDRELFRGRVRQTWLRGLCVYNDRTFTGPHGRFIASPVDSG
jgi:allantoinase